MTERWRCFVAVALDTELRDRLAASVGAWSADPRTDGLRWVEPANLHLTLAFLGPVDADRIHDISAALARLVEAHPAHAVPTGRLGAFPRPSSARVLWYGVADPGGALGTLARDVTLTLGLEPVEEYHPHITLARARRRPVDLRGWIEPASTGAPRGELTVDALRLARSHLGVGPARYETLTTVTLPEAR